MSDVAAVKHTIEVHIGRLETQPRTLFNLLQLRSLEKKLERLNSIESLLAIKRHRLVFIGTVGCGKTTAICRLLDLIDTTSEREIFATASGRTTLCEVVVRTDERTFFEVECFDSDAVAGLLRTLAESLMAQVNPNLYEKAGDALSHEVERALRNMIGLPRKTETVQEGGKPKKKEIDPARDRAKELNDTEALYTSFVESVALEQRSVQELQPSAGVPVRQWLRETFDALNTGSLRAVGLPRRITLHVTNDAYDAPALRGFSDVVDTKGLDDIPGRTDIRDLLADPQTLCLFTSRFNDAPERNAFDLMVSELETRSREIEIKHRVLMLVLPRMDEPQEVKTADGSPAGTWDDGVAIRTGQILTTFQNHQAPLPEEDIVYYDAFRYYEKSKNGVWRTSEADSVRQDRGETWATITGSVKRRRDYLNSQVENLEHEVAELIKSVTLSADDEKAITDFQGILEFSDISLDLAELVPSLLGFIRQKFYAIQFHAINRRFGVDHVRQWSLFELAREHTAQLVRAGTNSKRRDLIKALEQIRGRERVSDALKEFAAEMIKQVDLCYDGFVRDTAEAVKAELEVDLDRAAVDESFWEPVVSEWGKGPGYWNRVQTHYAEKLTDDIAALGGTHAAERWSLEVVQELQKFFVE
jgi:hypothetical protein